MSKPPPRLHEAISDLLGHKLQKYISDNDADKNLTVLVCTQIFTEIFDTFVEVLENSKVEISNEAMNYLAQQYYDGILINNQYELNPNIFTQRAKVENIETKELALMAMMLNGTDFAVPLIMEVKRRS